jgi:hypothetical protein
VQPVEYPHCISGEGLSRLRQKYSGVLYAIQTTLSLLSTLNDNILQRVHVACATVRCIRCLYFGTATGEAMWRNCGYMLSEMS